MRTMLTVAAVVVFAVSTGLLEMASPHTRPMTALPPAMGEFAAVDRTVTSSVSLQRLDER